MKHPNTFGVIGAGNGGLAIAGNLAINGKDVKIYDIIPEVIEEINRAKGIYLEGKIKGFGKIRQATTEISEVVKTSKVLMIVVPATAHRTVALNIAPYIQDEQTIVLVPGATGGSLEFYKSLKEINPKKSVVLAETQSLFYACRSESVGTSTIYGIKKTLGIAALPAVKTNEVIEQLKDVFPQLYAVDNVLKTGLENLNAILHPIPTLLNAGLIEKGKTFKYYWEGITPVTSKILQKLDEERMQIGAAFGFELTSTAEWLKHYYGISKEKRSLEDIIKSNKAYEHIYSPESLNNRFLTEDIPMGLYPMMEIGKLVGVSTENMESVIKFSELLVDKTINKNARTLKILGLERKTISDILNAIEKDPSKIIS